MEGKLYNRKNRTTAILIYMSIFIAYLAISRVVPLIYALTDPINALVSSVLAGIGVLLLLQDLLTDRIMFQAKNWWILMLFLVVIGISSLASYQYGISDNIKTMIWFCIHFFIFYTIVPRLGDRKSEKFIRRILFGIGALWTICVLISVAQYAFQLGYHAFMHEGLLKRQGFIENRLFGLFSDPNAAALMSMCLIFAIFYLMETDKCLWKRCLGIIAVILHFTYIILSGSRTVVICLFIAGCIKTALMFWNHCSRGQYTLRRTTVTLISSVLIFCAIFFCVYTPYKKSLSYVPLWADRFGPVKQVISVVLKPELPSKKPSSSMTEDPFKDPDLAENFDAEHVFSREDVREDNILNNRQLIWKGYLSSLHGSKWIIGLSPRNSVPYIMEHDPTNYIAQTQYIVHSDYIAVLAYTGLAGVATVVLFFVFAVISVFRKLKEHKQCNSFYIMALSSLCGMGVFAMSYMDILFCNTLTGVLFWMLASVALHYGDGKIASTDLQK